MLVEVLQVRPGDDLSVTYEIPCNGALAVSPSVLQARKLIKELQAQLAAAEAAAVLTSCMSRRPCGSNALKSAIAKAEAAAPAVSGTATTTTMAGSSSASGAALGAASAAAAAGGSAAASSSCVFSELLVVRLQAAKKRLEVERAAEVLHKAAVTYKNVADLPKLETAVLNARKVGFKHPHTVHLWHAGVVAVLRGTLAWAILQSCSQHSCGGGCCCY
jgi:hypothetical protein